MGGFRAWKYAYLMITGGLRMVDAWQADGGMKMGGLGFYLWWPDCLNDVELFDGHGEMVDGFDSVGGAFHMELSVLLMFWKTLSSR